MCAFNIFKRNRSRKYPIIRDESGKSARNRAFDLFEDGTGLGEISEEVGIKIQTVYKYHQQWMNNQHIEQQIKFFGELFKKTAPERNKSIDLFASVCGITPDELEAILAKPHGLRSLLNRKFRLPAHDDMDHRLHISFVLALLISEHLTENGGKFQDVFVAFKRLLEQAMAEREENEDEINRYNQGMILAHRILADDMDKETMIPDSLTPKEKEKAMTWSRRKSQRELEVRYWVRIGELMSKGCTREQAREKIYQDLIAKGDLQGAREIREFQDEVDPVPAKDSKSLRSPKQTTPSE